MHEKTPSDVTACRGEYIRAALGSESGGLIHWNDFGVSSAVRARKPLKTCWDVIAGFYQFGKSLQDNPQLPSHPVYASSTDSRVWIPNPFFPGRPNQTGTAGRYSPVPQSWKCAGSDSANHRDARAFSLC
ncbi:hypothetical protein AVEN_60914-1 [Araneus ventricosus]|uniref:Uncharacterized protein n=1 Tax=Araneus ventricosus TaxID=182803 RepID=A0A4Y2KNH8_ARAVE|nr:hypothetical protein AVEN_60914-1 [Araneus ventricosus]